MIYSLIEFITKTNVYIYSASISNIHIFCELFLTRSIPLFGMREQPTVQNHAHDSLMFQPTGKHKQLGQVYTTVRGHVHLVLPAYTYISSMFRKLISAYRTQNLDNLQPTCSILSKKESKMDVDKFWRQTALPLIFAVPKFYFRF